MISSQDLERRYAELSINELMEIIDNKMEYTDLAVAVAFDELAKRKLTEEDIKRYKEDKIEMVETFIARNIIDDLKIIQKLLFFIFWIPILNFAFRQNFMEDGYLLKLKQAKYYSWFGFAFFMLTAIPAVAFDLSNVASFAIWFSSFLIAYSFDEMFNRQRQIRKLDLMFGGKNVDKNEDKSVS